jgi:hypothetical protein
MTSRDRIISEVCDFMDTFSPEELTDHELADMVVLLRHARERLTPANVIAWSREQCGTESSSPASNQKGRVSNAPPSARHHSPVTGRTRVPVNPTIHGQREL